MAFNKFNFLIVQLLCVQNTLKYLRQKFLFIYLSRYSFLGTIISFDIYSLYKPSKTSFLYLFVQKLLSFSILLLFYCELLQGYKNRHFNVWFNFSLSKIVFHPIQSCFSLLFQAVSVENLECTLHSLLIFVIFNSYHHLFLILVIFSEDFQCYENLLSYSDFSVLSSHDSLLFFNLSIGCIIDEFIEYLCFPHLVEMTPSLLQSNSLFLLFSSVYF